MKGIEEHHIHLNGLHVHMIETAKYKTNSLILMLKAPLQEETAAKRALLSNVLPNGTMKSPSRIEIRQRLDDLYGALLSTDVQKKGEQHIITIRLDIANEQFLSDHSPLFEKGVALLSEILLEPKVVSGRFDETIVKNEKRALVQQIQSIYDDKMRYANVRITEEMCKNEPYGLSTYGKKEQVDNISNEDLYSYYQEMLNQDRIDLFVVGTVPEEELLSHVNTYFSGLMNNERREQATETTPSPEVAAENVVFEEQDVKQGKLHIGYRTYTTFKDPDYVPMQVMNGLFGGFSHSKLFINVREKESLAYYAASRFESHKGLMMVMSGIDFANYDKAVAIIKEQHDLMCQGSFSDEEVEQTKAMLKNQLLETTDVARGHVELVYHTVVSGFERSIDQWLREIDDVTKEDIIEAAKKVKLDTIYFLKGKEATS
ncbi:EF-P 5-aminopentanol modification-associated protein YfmF [Halalkalibacterium ligniniphilum]|uniref:EF-P 5-aminopentanol modification-associated protein YfmF n=1 Tax=Halalkalibacterium ligniniphilum TaxID=1134413 RepID=UPI000347847B|nr:pitrilysin family protein [Halalkalibacterium ligniniphilum]